MMNTNDITARQFETLVIVKILEDCSTSTDYGTISELAEKILNEDGLKLTDYSPNREQFIEDVCALTKHGYIVSDMVEPDDILDMIPDIDGITPKGQTVLAEFEPQAKEAIKGNKKFVLFDNLNINISFLGGIDVNTNLFKSAGDFLKQFIK